jgi:hypothetical protein
MKQLLILTGIIILSSCSTAWHYNKIERKDPNFWSQFNDTIQMPFVTYDTIYHDGDTIAIIQRIEYRDTIIQTRMINPKSRFDYKSEALQLRHDLKIEREQTKQLKEDNKTLRTQSRTERTDIRQTNRTERTETRKQHRGARTFLLCLISFVVGCLIGMAFMFKHRMNVLRWLRGF